MSFETLLAAADFLESNAVPGVLTRGSSDIVENPFLILRANDKDNKLRQHAELSKPAGTVVRSPGENVRNAHNKLEKNRRALLKECFLGLQRQIPTGEERRSSHLDVLRMAIKYVKTLKERGQELERSRMELEQQKSCLQHRLLVLQLNEMPTYIPQSPSTDTADDSPYISDDEGISCSNFSTPSSKTFRNASTNVCDDSCSAVLDMSNVTVSACHTTSVAVAQTSLEGRYPVMLDSGVQTSTGEGVRHSVATSSTASSRVAVVGTADGRSPATVSTSHLGRQEAGTWPAAVLLPKQSQPVMHIGPQTVLVKKAGSSTVQDLTSLCHVGSATDWKTQAASQSDQQSVSSHPVCYSMLPAEMAGGGCMTPVLQLGSLMSSGNMILNAPNANGSSSSYIIAFNQMPLSASSQLSLVAQPQSLTSKNRQPASAAGEMLHPAVGQLVFCPSVSSFGHSQVVSSMPFFAVPSEQGRGCHSVLETVQPVPILQLPQLASVLQMVPVNAVPGRSTISGVGDSSSVFVAPH